MMLEADSIWLEIEGRKNLQSIYLKIEKGRITGLLGRNGTGKSSLLKVIFGILKGESQSVRVNGTYVPEPYLAKGLIRYLPQHAFIPKSMKVKMACELYNIPFESLTQSFPEFDLYKKQKIADLSGGYVRLLEIMLILLSPVQFVLLDEPFAQLAPVIIEKLLPILEKQKLQKGILLSDHTYKNVLAVSDDIYLLVPVGRSILLKEPELELKSLGYIR